MRLFVCCVINYYTDVLEGVTLFYSHDVRMVPKRMTKEGAFSLGRMVVQVFWEYGFLEGNFIIYKTPITTLFNAISFSRYCFR